jgi:hypothetical protein
MFGKGKQMSSMKKRGGLHWPSTESPKFQPFVNDMLAGKIPQISNVDYTMHAAPSQNNCVTGDKSVSGPIQLQPYQKILPYIIGPQSPLNRLLYVASTGSGKTCSIHHIAASYLLKAAFERRTPPQIYVVVPGNAQANEILEQALQCPGPMYAEIVVREKLAWNNPEHRQRIISLLGKYFKVLTYVQFGNMLSVSKSDSHAKQFQKSIIFFDEVHNLVNAVERNAHTNLLEPTFKNVSNRWRSSLSKVYKILNEQKINNRFHNSVIIGLTATPIVNQPEDMLLLINTLFGKQVINPETFREKFVTATGELTTDRTKVAELLYPLRGKIAMYNNRNDTDVYASTLLQPYIRVSYSASQIHKLSDANVVNRDAYVNIVPSKMNKKERSEFAGVDGDERLMQASPKLAKVLENVLRIDREHGGKQLVFSNQERGGARGFMELLVMRGYRCYEGANKPGAGSTEDNDMIVSIDVETPELGALSPLNGTSAEVVSAHPVEVEDGQSGTPSLGAASGKGKQLIYLGNVGKKRDTRRSVADKLKMFNSPENRSGAVVPIAVLSSKYAEGVNFKGVRAIHFIEQPSEFAQFEQVVGRARRYCSHKELAYPKEWNIKVFQYISFDRNVLHNPDVENNHKRFVSAKLAKEFLDVVASVSLDCANNQNRTGFKCLTFI